ncbi:MAG: hypothetical protein FD165_668 [Gammaproteobacteria bacterium]|nr:MAG: hypothetical protein FD165_668 [Gammaproteobacteria bacterium]TND06995.1 MAG: hypothetical protein FD120_163 [Gammaproteobacteria bacterium]
MSIHEREVKWHNFVGLVSEFGLQYPYIYRGEAETWEHPLDTSLHRRIRALADNHQKKIEYRTEFELLRDEAAVQRIFMSGAYQHLRSEVLPINGNRFDWWCLMQHYGAPTRLLDWTWSPLVAAYFACIDKREQDGSIWFLYIPNLSKRMLRIDDTRPPASDREFEEYYLRPDAPQLVLPAAPFKRTDRMIAQQTVMSVSRSVKASQYLILKDTFADQNDSLGFGRMIIKAADKAQFIARLARLNVTGNVLFPGIDGLGKHVGQLLSDNILGLH